MQSGAVSFDPQAKLRTSIAVDFGRALARVVELAAETSPASGRSIRVRETPESRETLRTG